MTFRTAAFPAKDAIVDRVGRATKVLLDWATALADDTDAAPARLRTVTLTEQAAAIGLTSIPVGTVSAGLYRINWYARVTRPATTSSSLTVTFGWTESGQNVTLSSAALTGNTTTTVQSGIVLLRIDAGTPITYSTAYASSGGTSMAYRLDLVVEQLDA
jgi:hypothetical protein